MVQPDIRHNHQVVDLISDDESDNLTDNSAYFNDAWHDQDQLGNEEEYTDNAPAHGRAEVNNEAFIDLTAIPDIDVPPSEHDPDVLEENEPVFTIVESELITEAVCLQSILDVFPDISIDHVLAMIRKRTTDLTRTKKHSERMINELLEGDYPKEVDVVSKKRKRQDSEGPSDYEKDENDPGNFTYDTDA